MRVGQQHSARWCSSVQQDWRTWLSPSAAEVFLIVTQHLDTAYNIFSVALNEALELRRLGKLGKSYQAVYITPSLCKRLVRPLVGLLGALAEHARQYRTVPSAAPLNISNFQGARSQRSARLNQLLSRVLLSQRSQFLHKIATLQEMVGSLEQDFRVAAEELGMGMSINPAVDWRIVDIAHYDLNTCLREGEVLLKSFLLSIPEDQLGVFQTAADGQMRAPGAPSDSVCVISPKRMAASGGK